jgi:hypothetical protein
MPFVEPVITGIRRIATWKRSEIASNKGQRKIWILWDSVRHSQAGLRAYGPAWHGRFSGEHVARSSARKLAASDLCPVAAFGEVRKSDWNVDVPLTVSSSR